MEQESQGVWTSAERAWFEGDWDAPSIGDRIEKPVEDKHWQPVADDDQCDRRTFMALLVRHLNRSRKV